MEGPPGGGGGGGGGGGRGTNNNSSSSSSSSLGIRVLICSGNLGNAQPNLASLNEWIPLNGQCHLAMPRPPRFPVVMDPRRAKNPNEEEDDDDDDDDGKDNNNNNNNNGHPNATASPWQQPNQPPSYHNNNEKSTIDGSDRSTPAYGFLPETAAGLPTKIMTAPGSRTRPQQQQQSSSMQMSSRDSLQSFESDSAFGEEESVDDGDEKVEIALEEKSKKKKKKKKSRGGHSTASMSDDEDVLLVSSNHSKDRKKKKKKDHKKDHGVSSSDDESLLRASSHSKDKKKKKKDHRKDGTADSSDEEDLLRTSTHSSRGKTKKKKDKKSRVVSSDEESSSSDDSTKDKKKKKRAKKKKREKNSRNASSYDDSTTSSEDSTSPKRKSQGKKKRKEKKATKPKSDDENFSSDSKEYEQDLEGDDGFNYDDTSEEAIGFSDLPGKRRSSLGGFLGATTPLERKNSSIHQNLSRSTHSNDPSIRFETNFPDDPSPSTPPTESVDRPKPPPPEDINYFDIIVIGMQEATFQTENSGKAARKNSMSDDGSLSEDDELDELVADITSFDFDAVQPTYSSSTRNSIPLDPGVLDSFDFDAIEPTYSAQDSPQKRKTRSSAAKVLGATLKAGKASYKASKKVGKVTMKTAKAVNTLATAKDHTSRPIHTAQQASAPVIDGGFPGWSDTDVLHYRFEDQLPNYDRALSYQLGEMRLLVYYNPMDIDLEVLSVKYQATGVGGLANKGGIVAEVVVNKSTRISFLTAHLEAHEGEEKYTTRCTSFMDILRGAKSSYTPMKFDATLSSHFTFAMGDLNFRTRIPDVEPGSERHITICHGMAAAKDWKMINKYDELASALRKKDCLVGFRTPYCNFDPTFKVARQDGYEYHPKRSPSYTDRILFRTGDQLDAALRPILYEPIERFTTSDHKPIRGAFFIRLNERVRWKPALSMKKISRRQSKDAVEAPKTRIVNRERMNVFVSAISVVINPDSYDKIRKAKKAELPNSYISFISTPPEAVQVDKSKKSTWKGLVGSKGGKPTKSSSDGKIQSILSSSGTKLTSGFPTTSTIKDTMKPNWKKESLHFAVRTHLVTGDPIDLSGALLHLSMFDKKDEKSIGTFSLNLARLITVTKNPSLVTAYTASNGPPPVGRGSPVNPGRVGRGAPPGRGRGGPPQQEGRGGGGRGAPPGRGGPPQQEGRGIGGRGAGVAAPLSPSGRASGRIPISRTNSGGGRGAPAHRRAAADGGGAASLTANAGGGRRVSLEEMALAPGTAPDVASSGRGGGAAAGGDRASLSGPVGGGRAGGGERGGGGGGRNAGPPPRTRPGSAGRGPSGRGGPPNRSFSASSPEGRGAAGGAGGPMLVDRRGSLKYMSRGPSVSLKATVAADIDAPLDPSAIESALRDLKIVSLHLDEPLMEGGLEVARLRCNMDIWWETEQQLQDETEENLSWSRNK